MQTAYIIVQLLSAAFAFGAAALWFAASRNKVSSGILEDIQRLGGPDIFGSHQIDLIKAGMQQNIWNARAASCAAFAAVFQAAATVIALIPTQP